MTAILRRARRTNATASSFTTLRRTLLLPLVLALSLLGSAAQAQVDVTATAGTPAASYPTLKDAFDAVNAGTHQGDISVAVLASVTETATAALNASGSGAALYTSVLVRPSSAGVSVSGAIVGAIIKLNGADNVTIDGRVGGVGTARSLTVRNTSTSAATAAIWLSSAGAGLGSTNNVIRNLELACGTDTSASANSTYGIIMNGATISTTSNGDDNDNNQFIFNRITKVRYGIVTRGVTTNLNIAPIVTDNIIGPAAFGSDQINKVGIFMQADTGATVSRNIVQSVGCLDPQACAGADRVGIAIGTESWSMAPGTITSNSYTVTHNVIRDVIEETTFSGVGLLLATTGGGVATNNLVANNLIYNVRANGTSGDQAVGLGIAGGHTDVVVNNSISMTGDVDPGVAGASTNFGSGIRLGVASSANHANLTLRNNSVYMDLSSSSTAGVRFYAISGPSAAYAFGTGGENFNNYYINPANTQLQTGGLGTTASTVLTTQFATLANWQAAYTAPQDANSIQGDPDHVSPTADLHLFSTSPNIDTGTTVAAVTVDIDGEARPNGAAYDIGADEFYPTPGALQLSSATYSGNEGTTLLTTVNRVGGTSGAVGVTYTLANGSATGGAACGVGVDFIDPGPQALSFPDMVALQPVNVTLCSDAVFDAAETFTITLSLPTGGATLGSPTVATATIGNIDPPFTGPISVGSGQNYTSLTNLGGIFEAINLSGATGNITINVTSDLAGETGAVALNEIAGGFTLTIKPSGAPRSIVGSNAGALIKLNGADGVTIDGSTTGGTAVGVGGDPLLRELTIQNTSVSTSAVVIAVQSGTNGAQNNTLRNLIVTGQDPTTTLVAIAMGGNSPGTAGTDNDGNRVENCAVRRAFYGIYSAGQNAANPNTGTVITRNDLSSTTVDRIRRVGMFLVNDDGGIVTENSVGGVSTNESADAVGLGIGAQGLDATSIASGNVTNALVARNKIDGISSLSAVGFSAAGIAVSGGTTGPNTIVNNMIDGVTSPATAPDIVAGIWVAGVVGSTTNIYANTVALAGDRGTVAGQIGSYAIAITGTDPTVVLKNNILANSQTTTGGGADAKSYAIGMVSAAFANLDSNYNDFFASGASAGFFRTGSLGATGTDLATLGAWQTAVSDDANSLAVDPLLTSATDLHLAAGSPMLNAGVPLAAVTDDIDNDLRHPATPDIGADEVVADLAITKTDGVANVPPGTSTTYTIVATNLGSNNAAGATVTDIFPADLTCSTTCVGTLGASCTAGPILTSINDTVNLPVGGVVTYTAVCTLSPSAVGILSNTATVAPPIGITDPVPGNDSATDNDTTIPEANVSITKTDGSATEVPGTSVTYTIVATNAGPNTAAVVTIADTFAAALSGCSTTCVASAGSACTAGPVAGNVSDVASLLAGGTATYTATCNISVTATGALVNTATATVGGGVLDPATANNTATDTDTLVPTADVSITKTNGVTESTPGSAVIYTIVVTNAGPSAAPTVTVLDLFPATLTSCATTCTASAGSSCTAGPVVGNVNENANLQVGGVATYTASCTLSLSATGNLVNTATATVGGGATDPNTADNSATDTDTVGNTIFIDGFESGDTLLWSATVPLTVEAYAVLGVDTATSAAAFDYDFSAVKSGEALMPTAIAVVTDAAGQPLFILGARRTEAFGELELTLQFPGAGRSRWVPVSEVGQRVRIEWSLADLSSLGQATVTLDGLVVLRLEGYAGTVSPAGAQLLRSRQAPVAP